MISKCMRHNTYISGTRFIFKNGKDKAATRHMFAIICDEQTKTLFASYVKRVIGPSGESEDVIDIKKPLKESIGSRVPVSLKLYDNRVIFELGTQTIAQEIDIEVKGIELIGVGSNGVARFFEEDLSAQSKKNIVTSVFS